MAAARHRAIRGVAVPAFPSRAELATRVDDNFIDRVVRCSPMSPTLPSAIDLSAGLLRNEHEGKRTHAGVVCHQSQHDPYRIQLSLGV